MTTDLKIFILLYIASFVFNYFTLRENFLKNPLKPDYWDVLGVITSLFNFYFIAIIIVVEVITNGNIKVFFKNLPNLFFGLKNKL